ncbi:MAG: hypothetical protein ACP5HM_05920 [Anaerolineae bacterium]
MARYCGTYHNRKVSSCANCGLGMTTRCPECNARNWTGDEVCQTCGASVDLITRLTAYTNTVQRLERQMERARVLKEREGAAAEVRLARMLEEEEAEREALRRRIEA